MMIVQTSLANYRYFLYEYFFNKKISFHLFCSKDNRKIHGFIKSNDQKISNSIKELKHYYIGPIILYNFFKILKFIDKHQTIILDDNPRIIPTYIVMMYAFLKKKNIILWGHGESLRYISKKRSKFSIGWQMRKFMCYFSNFHYTYHDVATKILINSYNQPPSKLVTLNNTIEVCNMKNFTNISFNSRIKKTSFDICFLGRVSEDKGIKVFLKICEKFKTNPKYRFHIIGKCDDKNILKEISSYKNIISHGYHENLQTITEKIVNFDTILCPGFIGLVANHAMTSGCPIITYPNQYQNKIFHSYEFYYLKENKTLFYSDFSKKSLERIFLNIEKNREKIFFDCKELSLNFLSTKFINNFLSKII